MRHVFLAADQLSYNYHVLLSAGLIARPAARRPCTNRAANQPFGQIVHAAGSSPAVKTPTGPAFDTSACSQQSHDPDEAPPEPSDSDLIEIGIFLSPHGLQGELRLQPTTDYPQERLRSKATRWVQAQSKGRFPAEKRPINLAGGRPSVYKGHEIWLVRVAGINTPEAASLLRNHRLLMPMTELDMTDDDEFYPWELVGMQVHHQQTHASIGVVKEVYDSTGAHDVLRVQLVSGEGSVLIPFVKEIVPVVDRLYRKLQIDPPAGLLDLVTAVQKPKQTGGGLKSRSSSASSNAT